jgi:hypothetical protein
MKHLDATLAEITTAARSAIDWVDYASVCVAGDAGLDTLGATDPLVYTVDAAQYELREGPSSGVAPSTPIVHSPDVAHDPRWPRYARVAAELGIRSQVGALVGTGRPQVAVLNLYSRSNSQLDLAAADLARSYADQAATVIACVERVQALTDAVSSRQEISQAIGIAMERFGLSSSQAFEYLVRVSQGSQVKVREVAAELVARANERAVTGSEARPGQL